MASQSTDKVSIEPAEYRDPTLLLQTNTSPPSSIEEVPKEEEEVIDPKLDRRVKWKLDLFILPLMSSVYFFATMVSRSHSPFLVDVYSPSDRANRISATLRSPALARS